VARDVEVAGGNTLGGAERGERVVDERPVDEIARVENRQTGDVAETRGGEPIVVTDADGIGVGVVGEEDRILITAIAEIG
jgi:hypothetical protein